MGEEAESWQTWRDEVGNVPTIIGDADWGQLELEFNEAGRSKVYGFTSTVKKLFTLTTNRYQAGQGTATIQIRGSATYFTQDDNVISWIDYTAPTGYEWKFVQIRVIKLL